MLGPQAHYVLAQDCAARLLDLYLGDESPTPAVGGVPVDSKGKRRRMGARRATIAAVTRR